MNFLRRCKLFTLFSLALIMVPLTVEASTYSVAPGDSLYLISKKFGTSVNAIQAANQLNTTIIYPGQKLYIPDTYKVRSGDTLYLIGKKYGVPYQDIMTYNKLNSTYLYVGQVLLIPPTTSSVSRSYSPSYSKSDADLLARLITAEADSESYTTKVAVGAVVLNRVKSPLFPNTIPGVIYQVDSTGRYQFTPVLNGWINRPASAEAIRAAQEALKGVDPTRGALYFFESDVKNSFLHSRPVSTVLDSFTFAY
ncbi:LysM peptidoglycan-binding domain-containing protein [Desulfolucanica intricata]|uniref:LysM peptidoglycan-binding domain-containing protein n=1 Tax=Desulfolucanica intricata TaxID=1285191 RepID=UPI0008362FCA|nr:LysM peptidoglycan-binding domain-containing protein [Desulfolucanica intricata]